MEDWQKKLIEMGREYGVFVLIGLVGVGLVISGLWGGSALGRVNEVEIVKEGDPTLPTATFGAGKIVVDVAGAVEKPGVYEMEKDSRIGEAITMAGGLSAEADREWVTRFLNLAGEVVDGGKIFIPSETENEGDRDVVYREMGEGGDVMGVGSRQGGQVNINTASASELDSLWGIGSSRADSIIANRPYGSVEELMSKAGIPSNVFERIRDEVTIY